MKAALAACKDEIFPPGVVNNWRITVRSPFIRMLAVLFKPTPQVEQNAALLRCSRMLKSGRDLRASYEFHHLLSGVQYVCYRCQVLFGISTDNLS
jgi:hypothetical protein